MLGSAATFGAIFLLKESKYRQIDEQLHTFYIASQKEINSLQQILGGLAQLLQQNNETLPLETANEKLPIYRSPDNTAPVAIEINFVPMGQFANNTTPTTQMALTQAVVLGTPLNTILEGTDVTPALATLMIVGPPQKPVGANVIKVAADSILLSQLPRPANSAIHLLNNQGQLLSSTDPHPEIHPLNGDDLVKIEQNGFLIKTLNPPFGQRVIYGALPMMDRVFFLAISMPLSEIKSLITVMATRSTLSILGALILGAAIYSLLIHSIMAPVKKLLVATEAIASGQLDHRIKFDGGGEFGTLSQSFNHMLAQLDQLHREQLHHEKALAIAAEEIRHKDDIETKNELIARTNRELEFKIAEMSALIQCNQAMISTLDLSLLLDRILDKLQEILHCDGVVLLLKDDTANELSISKILGFEPERFSNVTFRQDVGLTGRAIREKHPVYIEDLHLTHVPPGVRNEFTADGSLLSVPMIIRSRLIGVIHLHKAEINGFGDTEIQLAQAIANQAGIAIENGQLYEQTRSLSLTDELTGLANRRHFQEILERERQHADRYNESFSIIMVDIDHFKKYNDCHGHVKGDTGLKQVANVLVENCRKMDLAARYGGEEFVLLLSHTDCAGAVKVAEKIRLAVESTHFHGAHQSQPSGKMTLSLGVATYPMHTRNLEDLVELADKALYYAKRNGRNRFEQAIPDQQQPLNFSS